MPSYSHSVKYFNTFDSTFCSTNSAENQTVYSDCAALGVSCKVYYNTALTLPVMGYEFIKFDGVVHEMNFDTGEINLPTDVQCPIPSVFIYRISVPANQTSYVDWTECEGYAGPKQLIYDRMRTIDVQAVENSVSASSAATISIVGNCNPYPSCDCFYIGGTTTTTTTIPPINFVLTPYCTGSGINGTGTINVNTFSGGNGTYQSIAIGTTSGTAFAATPINLSGASSYEFTGLFNGVYYIVLRDSSGAFSIKSTFVDCLNTTTTTSTTSTTTAAPICTYNGGSAVITYTTTTTSTTTIAPTTTTTTTSAPTTTTTTIGTYTFLGKGTPNDSDSITACSNYLSTRGYYALKPLANLIVNDVIYDTYPSSPTNGGGNWIALKSGGIGDAYSFQINSSGVITAIGGNCNATTTTTTTAAPGITLVVYAKDDGSASPELQYNINGGMWNNMGSVGSGCSLINSITGLSDGDVVTFQTDLGNVITSDGDTTTCPSSAPFACTTSYTISSGSPKFVAIRVDSTTSC
jgi:hypothetical protein